MSKQNLHRGLLGALLALLVACVGRTAPETRAGAPSAGNAGGTRTGVVSASAVTAGANGRAISTGDLLDISVFGAPELSRVTRVADDGSITMPLVGLVVAANRTPRQLEIALQDTLRKTYMRDPRVAVEVKEAAIAPIYVVGEVNQPGAFTQTGESRLTILRAVAVAGGLKSGAAQRAAVVIRPRPGAEPLHIPVNLDDAVSGRAPDLALYPNDVVFIPTNKQRAVTLGMIDAALRLVTFRAVF
jgi:polysaccharide export outer membrane protein